MLEIPLIVDAGLCQPCGGRCCKRTPGIFHPLQLAPEIIAELLKSGQYSLDSWSGDPRDPDDIPEGDEREEVFYFRPAIVGYEYEFVHRSYYGQCTLLTPTGCTLPADQRPAQCQVLVPEPSHECREVAGGYSKRDLARAWLPYQDWLLETYFVLEPEARYAT